MKSILTTLFLSLCSFVLNAQTTNDVSSKPSLQGVWQMCNPTGNYLATNPQTGEITLDTTKLQPVYFYKVFGNKDELTAMFITPVLSLITISGTYEVLSPNQYIEHVDYHSNPNYTNRDITLDYTFITDDYVLSSYKNEMGMTAQEVWKRLKQGNPATELNKLKEAGIIK
ncbi:DUF4488 domain-containing protein [uncultured Proteiniphilum sp.]|uniref:DUF4488 domain-containing protein n=1 Tax=uncultured Proteiniphilum sp. TaxID=497637 RepID=UPI00263152FE|nr:DUF4488 domain-containing protein [uncultured Proteiniphilum sp.]